MVNEYLKGAKMNNHILYLYKTIMDELDKQGLSDTQVCIEFLPRKAFINQTIRITVHNWDNGWNANQIIRREELELDENLAMDILKFLVKEVNK